MDYEYIDTAEALLALARRLEGEPLLAVDTEAAGYHRYLDRLSLVQLSTREENFLVDPLAVDDLSPLRPLLEDRAVEKLFHDADYDLRILDRDEKITVAGLFDTQIAAAFLGERSLGLGAIVEKYLGISLPKAYQRADWAERPLSEGMKDYAATDTVHLPALRDILRERLVEMGRLAWAEEEFERREGTRWSEPEDAENAFLRVKGARDLTGRGLAVLRELYQWREEAARERDQATFRVLGNQVLIALSLRPPQNAKELAATSGVPHWVAERRSRELMDAIHRGLAVPDSELPSFPRARRWERDPEVEARAERLRHTRTRVAEELGLDPGFLISRAVLDEVARQNPSTPEALLEVPDVRRWQVEAIGRDLLDALHG
ncbi:MAG TPA: ribonuclease D [Longimicrobiaceae bacterium]|nr:ribonuclease D [Longimicrobiaceae bacterium]